MWCTPTIVALQIAAASETSCVCAAQIQFILAQYRSSVSAYWENLVFWTHKCRQEKQSLVGLVWIGNPARFYFCISFWFYLYSTKMSPEIEISFPMKAAHQLQTTDREYIIKDKRRRLLPAQFVTYMDFNMALHFSKGGRHPNPHNFHSLVNLRFCAILLLHFKISDY